jgi:hypothetical protein
MKLVPFAVAVSLFASLAPAQAANYSNISAAEIERLLGGTEQEKSVATFYIGGVLDAYAMSNTVLTEQQGAPLFCPGTDEDLSPGAIAPKLLQHVAELRRKPRAAQSLQQLSAGTILLVMMTTSYPCHIAGEGQPVPLP